MTTEFEARAEAARTAMRSDTGDGWMSRNARDMVRLAAFAGFDVDDLLLRVALASPNRTVNMRTVNRVMGEMDAELRAANPELYAEVDRRRDEAWATLQAEATARKDQP